MNSHALLDLVLHGREERNLEYKPSLNWQDDNDKAKIVKACLAMANLRDGGTIVLGVEKSGAILTGVRADHIQLLISDHILAYVNEYADPFVELTVSTVSHDGKDFVVIQVREFADIPVICRKQHKHQNIRKGAVYTRSTRMPESVEVGSQTEMREIIELATIKSVRRFFETMQRAGISVNVEIEAFDRDRQAFDDQLGGL